MIKINEKYKLLFEQPENIRYYVVTGGRGSGKSYGVSIWACLKTFEQYCRVLYTRYTLKSADISIIPEFTEKLELLNVEKNFHVTKGEIVNTNTKSDILFRGIKTSSGNQTASLKSLSGVSVWILDEAEELVDESTFDKIDLSIRSQDSKNIIVLILNPTVREHWIYQRFFKQSGVQEGFNGIKDNVCYIHTTYQDNLDNLSDSFIANVNRIKQNEPNKYLHEILGGWLEHPEGVLFRKDQLHYFEKTDKNRIEATLSYVDTADKGTDFHCAVIGHIIGNKVYIEDVVYTRLDTSVNVDLTAELVNKYKPEYVRVETNFGGGMYCNMLRPKLRGDINLLAINNTTNKHSRIVTMAGFIKQHVYFKNQYEHDSDYAGFMHNILQYLADGKSDHDDGIDALVGLCMMVKAFYSHLWDELLE